LPQNKNLTNLIVNMPKTRDELCKQAMDAFITDNYDVTYNITPLTKNKANNLHCYEIVVPRLVKTYDIDAHTNNDNTVPADSVYQSQDVTTILSNFDAAFNNHFSEFALYTKETSKSDPTTVRDVKKSALEITLIGIDNECLTAWVQVLYHKGHKPYPCDAELTSTIANKETNHSDKQNDDDTEITEEAWMLDSNPDVRCLINQLKQEREDLRKLCHEKSNTIRTLEDEHKRSKHTYQFKYGQLKRMYETQCEQFRLLENDNYHYKRRYNLAKTEYTKMKKIVSATERLPTIIKTLYDNAKMNEDCPVCYEKMNIDNLEVPLCGHFICSTCSTRCTNCPICRV